MKKKSIREMFPHASQSTIDVNPHLKDVDTVIAKFIEHGQKAQTDADAIIAHAQKRKVRKPREMNQTEREFSHILESQVQTLKITRWLFEGITLRWRSIKEVIKYTPDFTVFNYGSGLALVSHRVKLIEVKGPRTTKGKFERAIERFRHAKTVFPEFEFEMWQKDENKQWNRLL